MMNRMPEWPLADDCDRNDLNMTPEEFRRAKACWKACDGFPTDALERGSVVVVTETVPENDGVGRLAHRHPAERQRDQLLAVLKNLLSGQAIEGLRGHTGMMDICVTGEDVRAGLESIAAVEQPAPAEKAGDQPRELLADFVKLMDECGNWPDSSEDMGRLAEIANRARGSVKGGA